MITKLISDNMILQDNHVLLRKLCTEDLKYLLPFAINEPDLWKFSLISGATENGLENYIKIAIEDHESGHSFPFIVYDKINNMYAGSTRFYDIRLASKRYN